MPIEEDKGWFDVNGTRYVVTYAQCDLFVGDLWIDFSLDDPRYDDGMMTLKCGEAIEYSQLHGFAEAIQDSKVQLTLGCVSYLLSHLEFHISRPDQNETVTLMLTITGKGEEWDIIDDEVPRQIEFATKFELTPEPLQLGRMSLPWRGIPAKFANFYLQRAKLGIPLLPENATREDVVRVFGPPIRESLNPGTLHPEFNFVIPDWTVHNFGSFGLRCSYSEQLLTYVSVVAAAPDESGVFRLLSE